MEDMRKILTAPMFLSFDDANPFEGLMISENWKILDTVESRSVCKKCSKSRKYFCYTCYLPLPGLENYVPKVNLPIKIDIVKHAKEKNGKSTASHAALLAPDHVTIYTYPTIPDYNLEKNTVLIYPGKNAKPLKEILQNFKMKSEKSIEGSKENLYIKRAVFIDSTWNQSHGILQDPRICGLPCCVLKTRISQFWRYQSGSPRWYLATIEAVHQFVTELVYLMRQEISKSEDQSNNDSEGCSETRHMPANGGEFDNLLFIFRFMYGKIHSMYDHNDLLSYKRSLE